MGLKEIFAIIMAGVIANNFVMQQFLGIDAVLAGGKNACKNFRLGLIVALVMVLSTAAAWALNAYVLAGAAYLQLFAFVLVTLVVTALVQTAFKKCGAELGAGFGLIAVNAAVLGACLLTAAEGFLTAVLTALGAGLGFAAAMAVYTALRGRVNDAAAPKAFRGLPLSLLTAGMICLALSALK